MSGCPRIELASVLAPAYELATLVPRYPTIPMMSPVVMAMLVVMNVLPGWLANLPREKWVVLGVAKSGTAPGKRTTSTVCSWVEVPASNGMRRPTMVKFTGAVNQNPRALPVKIDACVPTKSVDTTDITHWLLVHSSPPVQAPATPHRQPMGPQLFATVGLQTTHCAPGVPHWLTDVVGTHVVPLQQPVGQVVESQMHWLLTQWSDAPHGAPTPQRQPVVEQVSALAGSQAVQVAPPVPHCDTVPGERQAVPLQQPDGHEAESHTHWLLRQRAPAVHAEPVPHLQPVEPQLLASVMLQLTHWAPPDPH